MFKIMVASCACSTVLASQEMEPNLKSWQVMFNEKEIIFADGINSHNTH